MKKLILIALAFVAFTSYTQAQEISKNAIGLRLGDSNGFGAEVSYQRAIGDNNRLEFDLGWRTGNHYDGVKLIGLYQWVWNIDGGFNWYAGPGAGFAAYSFDHDHYYNHPNFHDHDDKDAFIILAGTVGIEYSFDFPLQLSLDLRPELGFGDSYYDNNDLDFDVGLGVRYQF
ncbi:hypothetical protein LRR18_09285 [Mangrovimonas sp. AS39]|uniref:hypothetical protein n=1 Tax=Mangrovimonas futianensis TaxID=2895523 RepID=UPI001E58D5A3|nr:hypothetical protein [Mangrovimonas futianensis]MCF1191778.1 hypothetical protein [Mangrovimonas futianensis]MCF1195334.1 hypothetical protein [Mangrovimonas futianensis]MCF1422058.1 hypothetical protein [Mangrovimonas futianensis]